MNITLNLRFFIENFLKIAITAVLLNNSEQMLLYDCYLLGATIP